MATEKRLFLSNRQRFILDAVKYYQKHYPRENKQIIARCRFLRQTRQFPTAKMAGFEDIRFACSTPAKLERAMLGTINNPQFLQLYFSKNENDRQLLMQLIFEKNLTGDPDFNYQESPFLRDEKELLWFIKMFPEYTIPQKI